MKQWKLILVTLLAVLMVCVCTSAVAEDAHVCETRLKVTLKPTCTEAGIYTLYQCSDPECDNYENELESWPIKANGHDLKKSNIIKPTCTTEGYDKYSCKNCDYTEKQNVVAALGHTEIAWGTRKEATCVEEGIFVYGCSVCEKEVRTEAIKKNPDNHPATKYAEKKWDTCTEDGYEAHYYCDDCGWKGNTYKVIPAPGHAYIVQYHKTNPTCSATGIDVEKCKWCGDVIETVTDKVATAHTAITVPAKNNSCTEDGYNTYDKCKDCGVILSNNGVIPVTKAYGHKYQTVDWKVKPDCVTVGIMYERCAHCKDLIEVEKAKDPDGHKWSTVPGKNNSCTEEGYKSYDKCTLCGKIATADGQVPVTKPYGHAWIDSAVVKAATCTEAGVMKQRCTHCNATQEVEIKKLPHTEVLETNLSYAATCTEDGLNVYVCKTCDEFVREEVLPKAEHVMRLHQIVAPTCEEDGYEIWLCQKCGENEERRVVNALGHDWKTVRIEKPTCTKEGYTQQYCAQCKEYQNIEKTQKIAHKFTVKDATKAPTCESEGFTWYYCEYKCGERTKLDIKSATGHNYKLVANTPASCQAEGLQFFECYNDGCETPAKSEKIAVLPHNYAPSKWQVIVEPKCGEYGRKMNLCTMCNGEPIYEDVPALEHKYGEPIAYTGQAPTCTEAGEGAKYCEYCKHAVTVVINPTGHDLKETEVVPATCTGNGLKKVTCKNKCGLTKYELIPAFGHQNLEQVSKTEPTCTEAGEIVKKCADCGTTVPEVIPATGHQHTKEEIVKAPTCTEAGSNKVVCTDCNTVIETKEVAAKGHGATKEIADKAATCTEAGSINVICTVCGETLETKEVAALGHGTTKEEAVKAATCTEAGSINVICTVCGETLETKEVAALGHELDEGVVTAPTCTEDGYTTYACTRCDYTEVKDETKATGHVDTKEVETLAPTCTEAGNIDVVCACGEVVESKAVEALGHDMVAGEVTAPTCTEKGYTTYECSRCDATEIKDETEALGHTYEWVMDAVVASPAAPGENWYQCSVCEDIADIEYVKYTKYYYENTLTSFGPTTEELLGEGDWYRVTPIDLSVDGIYTFDLIASNAYVVGTVTITVSEGVMTVSYDVNANHIEVLEEALVLYASKADLAEGKGVTVAFGEEINLAETFGEDSKVLVSLMLIGTYDAAGYGVYGFEADAEEIAELLAIVD